MTKFSKSKIIILFSIFYFLFSSTATLAAQLNIVSEVREIGIGQEFQVDLIVDTEGKEINAVEGKIIFPADFLELKDIYDGDSIINFWVQKPAYNPETGIIFSGLIPGGFSGVFSPYSGLKPGKILGLVFSTKNVGIADIKIENAKILLNDGQGTPAELRIENYELRIISLPIPDSSFLIPDSKKDTDPPESFLPEIVASPDFFDGKWFLVFAAQDKRSGVDYYEVQEIGKREPESGGWVKAKSPYVLQGQGLKSYIFVRAVDKAGNIRTVFLPPRSAAWYKNPLVDIIIGLGVLIVILLNKQLLLKLKKIFFKRLPTWR